MNLTLQDGMSMDVSTKGMDDSITCLLVPISSVLLVPMTSGKPQQFEQQTVSLNR